MSVHASFASLWADDHWSCFENLCICISDQVRALMLDGKSAVRYQIATYLEHRPDASVYDCAFKTFSFKPKRPECDLQMTTSDWLMRENERA